MVWQSVKPGEPAMLRVFRSPKAHFEHDAEYADRVYTSDALQAIAAAGFNAVWIRVKGFEICCDPQYPELGAHAEALIRNLNLVAERGASCGVKLVVYCQEPLGLNQDDPFWDKHPEMAGADWGYNYGTEAEPEYMRAFCMSSEPVRAYLADNMETLLRRVPGVAAVITITFSEFQAHCFSHHGRGKGEINCPRCLAQGRTAADTVAEVLNTMRAGMDRVNPDTPLIAWNWSWVGFEDDPQPSVLGALDPRIAILADFERGDTRVDPFGKKVDQNEYSLSYIGPTKRFLSIRDLAAEQGRPVYAKLQVGTTHEIATVSNLPLIPNLYRKTRNFRRLGLAGFMGCWNFGNELSLNTRAFNRFLGDDCPKEEKAALLALARDEFPGADVDGIVQAWQLFSEAFEFYPFSIPFIYMSPINYSLALPMRPGPLHEAAIKRSWLMDPRDDRDDPARCFGPYTPEEIRERLERLNELWQKGLAQFEAAAAGLDTQTAREELSAARAIALSLRSLRNYLQLYFLKRDWRDEHLPAMLAIAKDELAAVEAAIPVYEIDPRQGFHIEGHGYMVSPELLRTKRDELKKLLMEKA
jgi:hypothetical protein